MRDENLQRSLEAMATDSQEYFRKSQRLQERLTGLVGTAATPDGLVRVVWAGDAPRELEIGPRAMKLGSAELAETILRLIGEAKADIGRQTQEIVADLFGQDENPTDLMRNKDKIFESLEVMRESFTSTTDETMDMIRKLQRHLGG